MTPRSARLTVYGLASFAFLTACSPSEGTQTARHDAFEQRLAALENRQHIQTGPLQFYEFDLSEDPVSIALADMGELGVLMTFGSAAPQGDSQLVTVGVTNPTSLQMRSLKFNVSWRTRGPETHAGQREVEWSGQLDPGHQTDVEFSIGPLSTENLGVVSISGVRTRWAVRRTP